MNKQKMLDIMFQNLLKLIFFEVESSNLYTLIFIFLKSL